jgi:hypothetical protein
MNEKKNNKSLENNVLDRDSFMHKSPSNRKNKIVGIEGNNQL